MCLAALLYLHFLPRLITMSVWCRSVAGWDYLSVSALRGGHPAGCSLPSRLRQWIALDEQV